jgi:glycosyltransferase involved in cell wall biosynthesis
LGKSIDEEINRIRLENFTRIPFYRPSSDIFAVSDVYVLPSEYEGMPMVVLEAQAMGKPVVVTDVGNNREILDKTHGGIIIDKVGDISAIRLAIRKMLENSPDPQSVRQVILDHNSLGIYKMYKKPLVGS